MPITKSAIKRAKQTKIRHKRNLAYELRIKNLIKMIRKAQAAGNQQEIDKLLKETHQAIDKAVNKKLIHKNKGARKKSRLVKSLKSKSR